MKMRIGDEMGGMEVDAESNDIRYAYILEYATAGCRYAFVRLRRKEELHNEAWRSFEVNRGGEKLPERVERAIEASRYMFSALAMYGAEMI